MTSSTNSGMQAWRKSPVCLFRSRKTQPHVVSLHSWLLSGQWTSMLTNLLSTLLLCGSASLDMLLGLPRFVLLSCYCNYSSVCPRLCGKMLRNYKHKSINYHWSLVWPILPSFCHLLAHCLSFWCTSSSHQTEELWEWRHHGILYIGLCRTCHLNTHIYFFNLFSHMKILLLSNSGNRSRGAQD